MNSQLQRMVGAAVGTLAVSLAVAAQACASGGAGVHPNNRPGPLGVGSGGSFTAVVAPGAFGRAVLRADRPLYPDDRAGLRWHGDSGRIGIYSDDRAGLRGASPTSTRS